jgi:hypothetical protein
MLPAGVPQLVQQASTKYGVPSNIITGLIHVESSGNPDAHAPTSTAKGLMQLTDGTAHAMGVANAYDPAQNVDGGTKYLAKMIDLHHGDVREGLAAYYGSRDRAANLNYADKVLKAAGPSLQSPSIPSGQQNQAADVPGLPAGFTLDGAPQQSNASASTDQPQFTNGQEIKEELKGAGKGSLAQAEAFEHAIAPKGTFFGSGDPDVNLTPDNDSQQAGYSARCARSRCCG